MDTQNVLLQLNIADDYFKAKKQIGILEEDLKNKNDEVYAFVGTPALRTQHTVYCSPVNST